jgi:hypothetical protein
MLPVALLVRTSRPQVVQVPVLPGTIQFITLFLCPSPVILHNPCKAFPALPGTSRTVPTMPRPISTMQRKFPFLIEHKFNKKFRVSPIPERNKPRIDYLPECFHSILLVYNMMRQGTKTQKVFSNFLPRNACVVKAHNTLDTIFFQAVFQAGKSKPYPAIIPVQETKARSVNTDISFVLIPLYGPAVYIVSVLYYSPSAKRACIYLIAHSKGFTGNVFFRKPRRSIHAHKLL